MQKIVTNEVYKPLLEKGLIFFDKKIKQDYSKKYLIGVDEAGRGPLAGPVVSCACLISDYSLPFLSEINDSKKLTENKRKELFKKMISSTSIRFGFAYSTNYEIDSLNILNATLKSMNTAIERLINYLKIDRNDVLILIDGNKTLKTDIQQIAVVKGDTKSAACACASIFAKVLRDRWMDVIDLTHPEYEFKKHKGYPTKKHFELIKKLGTTPYHRKSFAPCKNV